VQQSAQTRITSTQPVVVHSSGDDPYLTLALNKVGSDGRAVAGQTLTVVMESNVSSYAKIYFTEPGTERFSESFTPAQPVRPGLNRLQFAVDGKAIGPALRFDSLECAGRVVVHEMRFS